MNEDTMDIELLKEASEHQELTEKIKKKLDDNVKNVYQDADKKLAL